MYQVPHSMGIRLPATIRGSNIHRIISPILGPYGLSETQLSWTKSPPRSGPVLLIARLARGGAWDSKSPFIPASGKPGYGGTISGGCGGPGRAGAASRS
jgi:hypothetical protein